MPISYFRRLNFVTRHVIIVVTFVATQSHWMVLDFVARRKVVTFVVNFPTSYLSQSRCCTEIDLLFPGWQ